MSTPAEFAVPGLHDAIEAFIERLDFPTGSSAVDLGTGPGGMAVRLQNRGFEVEAVDKTDEHYRADVKFTRRDLNTPFARSLDGPYDLVVAAEVIEHLVAPSAFLAEVRGLLVEGGAAIITTPNVDSFLSRARFFLTGKLRMMDERGDPTHISPIFWDLLTRRYLPRAGLELVDHVTHPPNGYIASRPIVASVVGAVSRFARSTIASGDNHILAVTPC